MEERYKTSEELFKNPPSQEEIRKFIEEKYTKKQFEEIGKLFLSIANAFDEIPTSKLSKESLYPLLSFVRLYDILTSEEKEELERQIEEHSLQVTPDGTKAYDKGDISCNTSSMTKILTNTSSLTPYRKLDYLSMLAATYSKAFFTGKETDKVVTVNNYKTKEKAEVLLSILPPEITSSENIKIENPLDEYDREIMNALHTIWEDGIRRFTPQNVYLTMTGAKTTDRKKLDEISTRIQKLDQTRVSIQLNELFEKVYKNVKEEDKINTIWESRIINVDRIRWVDEHNKQTIQEGFVFLKEPTLTTVCKLGSYHITTVPITLISAPRKKVSLTPINTALINFLASRISMMKNEPKLSRDILFETIFTENNLLGKSRSELARVRNNIFSILDAWKEEKQIKDYNINKKGKSYHSITIVL